MSSYLPPPPPKQPLNRGHCPRTSVIIAHDERTGNYLAYRDDGSVYSTPGPSDRTKIRRPPELHKRDSARCIKLDAGGAKYIKGWKKIGEYADKNWGRGSVRSSRIRRIISGGYRMSSIEGVTTLNNFQPTKLQGTIGCHNMCIKPQGAPECHDEVKQHETAVGTNSTRLRVQSGYTIEWEAGPGIYWKSKGNKFLVTIHIPKFLDESVATTMSFSDSYSPQTMFNTSTPQEIWAVAKKGETCYPKMRTKRCKMVGKGRFKNIAGGLVWFVYDEPTGSPEKRQRWSVDIEKLLSVDDRLVREGVEFSGILVGSRQIYGGAGCEFKESRP
ncbi:hypothetical protein BD779DRAFT_1800358 [Infundibulicybe gibba]|nr:hypothetical protein BD779DRAFT_1800358 [Infundibulicybe gibba]